MSDLAMSIAAMFCDEIVGGGDDPDRAEEWEAKP